MKFAATAVLAASFAMAQVQASAQQPSPAAAQVEKTATDISAIEKSAMDKMIKGDKAGALAEFDAAIGETHSAEAYAARGRMHMRLHDYREAAGDFTAASAKDPDNVELLYARAMAEIKAGQPQKGIDAITRLLKISPRYPDARLMRGEAWRALGKHKKAAADFDEEVELFRDRPLARLSRGYFYLSRGNGEAALEDFIATDRLAPSPEARMAGIMALVESGKCDDAKEQLGLLLAPERMDMTQQEATAAAAYLINCGREPERAVALLGRVCVKTPIPLAAMKSGGLLAPLFKTLDKTAFSDLDKACPQDVKPQ